ncbi:MAG: hypothetical protein OJI67_08070 [Prosthecobacter sp.]|nr:hypothetical protein [Prosthecobacter sp.]
MGQFYTNHTIKGPSQQEVADALLGRSAYVTPSLDGCVVVYDELSEEQDAEVISDLGCMLSGQFHAPVLASLMHDDDVLMLFHFHEGELIDEYDSCPGYFDPDADGDPIPIGGDASSLCAAFGGDSPPQLEQILRKPPFDEDSPDQHERHSRIASHLGIPSCVVGIGFSYLESDDPLDGLDRTSLIRTA